MSWLYDLAIALAALTFAYFALLNLVYLVFTAVAAFRTLGSRVRDTEILSAHALYWYFAAAAYAAVWFVVYVTK